MVITTMLRNLKETGSPLSLRQWSLFTKNIWELGISDLLMVSSTAFSLPLHRLYKDSRGFLKWSHGGMAVQSILQAIWLAFWVRYVRVGNASPWPSSLTFPAAGHSSVTGLGLRKYSSLCIFLCCS